MAIKRGWSDAEQQAFDKTQGGSGAPGAGYDTTTYNPLVYGGGAQTIHTGDPNNPDTAAGPSSDQAALLRYRKMGGDAAHRDAFKLDFGAANANRTQNLAARGTQIDANTMLGGAAAGGAPSRAEIEGQQSGGNALDAALTAGAGARNPALAQPRGQMTPEQAAIQQQRSTLAGADQATGGRAAELNAARSAYGQSGAAMRGGDVALQGLDAGQAEAQGAAEMAQRQRNAQAQQQYEKMGIGVEQSQVDSTARLANLQNQSNEATNAAADAEKARAQGVYTGTSKTILGAAASDMRVKDPASLNEIRTKARSMLNQSKAQNDSLAYGPSTSGAIDRANSNDANDVNDSDVNAIKYGTQPYDRSMFRSPEAEKTAALHQGIEDRLGKDAEHTRRLQEAREDQEADRTRHGENLDALSYGQPKTGETGIGGAPKGYAASRTGAGAMFASPQAPMDHGQQWEQDHDRAPGTYDALKYGEPSARSERDQDPYSKAVSTSDATAKRQAFLDGANHSLNQEGSNPEPLPEYMRASVSEARARADRGEQQGNPHSEMVHVPEGLVPGREHPAEAMLRWTPGPPQPSQSAPKVPSTAREDHPDFFPPAKIERPTVASVETPDERTQRYLAKSRAAGPAFVPESTSDESVKDKMGDTTGGSVQDPELQRDANRQLRGETYKYKEGFGEETDRVHHGFMAQNLEKNPITATAVREDGTGVKKVDNTDALRVTAAGVAQLQDDNDQMRGELDKLLARRRRA